MHHAYIIHRYIKYYPSFGIRIIRAVPGIRIGYHVLSHNMYQYMPEMWTPWVIWKGNVSRGN